MQIGFEGSRTDLRCSFYYEHIQIKNNLLDIHHTISSCGAKKMIVQKKWAVPTGNQATIY